MNLYEQKFGNPQRVPCPDRVAVFRQKKGGSVTDNVVWACLLKHGAASPALSQTSSARQRKQPSCPGWAPSGGGQCLSAELCEGPLGGGVNQVHAENPESLSELRVCSVLLDQREEGINLPRAHPSIILVPVLKYFPKGSMLTGPRKGAPLFTPFTQASLCSWRAHYGGGEP